MTNVKSKNIVLIGNGFDLAHGLKTSYANFMQWYFSGILCQLHKSKIYKDEYWDINMKTTDIEVVRKIDANFLLTDRSYPQIKRNNRFLDLVGQFTLDENPLWADLEGVYYKRVRSFAQELIDRKEDSVIHSYIGELNTGFEYMKKELIQYLSKINIHAASASNSKKILEIFNTACNPTNTDAVVLNFNYTSTLDKYQKELCKAKVLNFHGSLNNQEKNPIVFGYGDTNEDHYKQLENLDDYRFIQFSKAIAYTNAQNYSILDDWLSRLGDHRFNVFIVGLSCGITDRVLLNTILEHDCCRHIHLYYYRDQENFIKTSANISRIFNDKKKYNKRMVPRSDDLKYAG